MYKKIDYIKKFIKTKSPYYHSKFKYYRNKLNHILRISKRQYYNEYFARNIKNSKFVWSGIKQIISLKPKANILPTKIIQGNQELTDNKSIANAFNNYFLNIFYYLNTRKSTCPFSIPANILKILKTVISKPLEILYYTSIS